MSPPERIIVGPYTFVIEYDKDFTDSHNAWAYIQFGAQRIRIDPDTKPERLRVAVMHELLHAIHDMTSAHNAEWEEQQVTRTRRCSLTCCAAIPTSWRF